MKKVSLAFLIVISFLFGCSKNPVGPLPPIEHQAETFEEHNARLLTPGHVHFWIKDFTAYRTGHWIVNEFGEGGYEFNQNWYHWDERGFPDQAYAVAYEMYKNYRDGVNGGQCGQFAATYVVALRDKGYRCGGICTFPVNDDAHAKAWIEDKNGKIIITDNKEIWGGGIKNYYYDSYEDLVAFYKKVFQSDDIQQGWFLNEKFEIIFDKNNDYEVPVPLNNFVD